MRPRIFEIPLVHLPIHAYGFMLMVGFIAAMVVAARRVKRFGLDPVLILDYGLLAMITGVLGARVWHFIEYRDHFRNPATGNVEWYRFFFVWEGGLVYYGGLIAAAAAVIWYSRWRRVPVWLMCDVLAPTVVLGLAFVRIGCFLNGCCYGGLTDSPLGLRFPLYVAGTERLSLPYGPGPIARQIARGLSDVVALADGTLLGPPVMPAQLFSSLGAFLVFAILVLYTPRSRARGEIFFLMLTVEAVARFFVETTRVDTSRENPLALSTGQVSALLIFLVALPLFLSRLVRGHMEARVTDPKLLPRY